MLDGKVQEIFGVFVDDATGTNCSGVAVFMEGVACQQGALKRKGDRDAIHGLLVPQCVRPATRRAQLSGHSIRSQTKPAVSLVTIAP
jgi:hypothetical protein